MSFRLHCMLTRYDIPNKLQSCWFRQDLNLYTDFGKKKKNNKNKNQ